MLHITKRGNYTNVQRLFPVYVFFMGNPKLTFSRWCPWTRKWNIGIYNNDVRSRYPRFRKRTKEKSTILFSYCRQLFKGFLQILSLYQKIINSNICYSVCYRPDRRMDIVPRMSHPSPRSYVWFLWYDFDRLAVGSRQTYAAASPLYVSDQKDTTVLLVNDSLTRIVRTYTYNTLDIYTQVCRYPGPKIFKN